MNFDTIIGFSREEAVSIVRDNTWLADNVNKNDVQRYIKYETDPTGKHVISISRSNIEAAGFTQIDKTLDVKNIVTNTDGKVAAFLFTVNANKGPNIQVKKFFASGGSVSGDTEKMFLGHVAWLVGNDGYGSDTDLLCKHERAFTEDNTLPMLDLSTGRDIFGSKLYLAFIEVKRVMDTPEFCPKERAVLLAGMAQDLQLVNRFI